MTRCPCPFGLMCRDQRRCQKGHDPEPGEVFELRAEVVRLVGLLKKTETPQGIAPLKHSTLRHASAFANRKLSALRAVLKSREVKETREMNGIESIAAALRARVAELEKERDAACKIADRYKAELHSALDTKEDERDG